jgi:hypothetical protein
MWNELGGAAVVDRDGLTTSHVVHVGRSWFRMTPVMSTATSTATKTDPIGVADAAAQAVKMGASLFEHAPSPSTVEDDYEEDGGSARKPWGTITLTWWGLGLAAAGLMVIGAALSVAMMQPRLARAPLPAPAPVATAVAVPVSPPSRPAMIEPLPVATAAKTVAVEPVASVAPPPRPAKAIAERAPVPAAAALPHESAKRPNVALPAKRARPAASVGSPREAAPEEKPWVDPFAD